MNRSEISTFTPLVGCASGIASYPVPEISWELAFLCGCLSTVLLITGVGEAGGEIYVSPEPSLEFSLLVCLVSLFLFGLGADFNAFSLPSLSFLCLVLCLV